MTELLEKALDYARHGWPVFPVAPRGKKPIVEKGFHDATTDEGVIQQWWGTYPNANIGLPTGKIPGFWVLDVDGMEGLKQIARLRAEHEDFPETAVARTGSGGLHYLFHYTGPIRQRARFAPGLDTRTDGGYIVAPPSIHQNGQRYRWESVGEIADAPPWLVALIAGPNIQEPTQPIAGGVLLGQRNAYLATFAGKLRRIGVEPRTLLAALAQENRDRCTPPLSDSEVFTIAQSISRYKPAEHLDVPVGTPAQEVPSTVRVFTMPELLAELFPVRAMLMGPWLKERTLTMLHAPRGAGKSYIALTIAMIVSGNMNGAAFGWTIPEYRDVLYVDAEMTGDEFQRRLRQFCPDAEAQDTLRILLADAADAPLPSLATPEGRLLTEDCIGESSLVVLDNVSTLFGGLGDYNAAESWDVAQEWLLAMRRRGVAILLIDHAGKTVGRGPRGTSRKEDIMDTCVELSVPEDCDIGEDGASFVWRFTKSRGLHGKALRSFRAELVEDGSEAWWKVEDSDAVDILQVYEMLDAGHSTRRISDALEMDRNKVIRLQKRRARLTT